MKYNLDLEINEKRYAHIFKTKHQVAAGDKIELSVGTYTVTQRYINLFGAVLVVTPDIWADHLIEDDGWRLATQ